MRRRWLHALLPLLTASPLEAQEPAARLRPLFDPRDTMTVPFPADSARTKAVDSIPLVALGLRVFGRTELGGEWLRQEPCDPALRMRCAPSLVPLVRPDTRFGVHAAGTIAGRIHVDVDYDQRRELVEANRIRVSYRGAEGEFLRSLEVGDVALRLPASRFLATSVPGGNFGVKAEARAGPWDLEAVWARQQGEVRTRELVLDGVGGTGGATQDVSFAVDDADYVRGRFFFLVDPHRLAGAPHVDALRLLPGDAPPDLAPAAGAGIHLYRDERISRTDPAQQARTGTFLAEARSDDGTLVHRGHFRRLVAGVDYVVHPSGLWLALRAPLRDDEALAVAYTTAAGTRVGTPDAEAADGVPVLRLLRGPASTHQPGGATWRFEMRQVYRVAAAGEVEAGSLAVEISLGERAAGITHRTAGGESISFLQLFGLDEEPPAEVVDESRLFSPGSDGTYLVFPTLAPFAEPPPAGGRTAAEAAAILGSDANPAIYDADDPILRHASARFRLSVRYRVRVDGGASSISLGAFGIREGSERITLGGRPLRLGLDYTIDYTLGTVTLTNPNLLLEGGGELRATWEQAAAFDVAPRTLAGVTARTALGDAGRLELVGLWHAEETLHARPALGLEPAALLLGGATGEVEFGAPWLDRVAALAPGDDDVASKIRVTGELAASLPDPNRRGQAWLDDFEDVAALPIALERHRWRLGSRPDDTLGDDGVLPRPMDETNVATLVWQHDIDQGGGRIGGALLPSEIDRAIRVAGPERGEPALYLTLDGEPDRVRWRSITTVLDPTGRDLSGSEVLEFYVAADESRNLALILDLGDVSEDVFTVDRHGRTGGVRADGRPWGLGVLDEEARAAEGEIWGPALDELGLWDDDCRAEPGRQSYPLGDPRANCTRGNGRPDTEDLDGDGILTDRDGALFRYVVRLDGSSPFLVRRASETGTRFRLYRIPLRGAGAALGGAGEATWRRIRYLRLTVAGRPAAGGGGDVVLARMRLVGSRWAKRHGHGILRGVSGDDVGSTIASFETGPASALTDGARYASPPGAAERLGDPRTILSGAGTGINEQALRLVYRDLAPGDRAEAYLRYPHEGRNFLDYRELRLYAVPRAGRWDGGERLVVSVGTDPDNRYLYVTPLRPPIDGPLHPGDWLPEIVIDVRRWLDLKAEAEQLLLERGGAGDEPLVLWSDDGAHGIVLTDRARAPNLATVRELALAVHNGGASPVTGKIWVNELRLGGAVAEAGFAGSLAVDVEAGDVARGWARVGGRGARFRNPGEAAGRPGVSEKAFGATASLGRLLPATWRIDAPLTVAHERQGRELEFLERSDVVADRIPGVRDLGAEETRVAFALRRVPEEGGAAARRCASSGGGRPWTRSRAARRRPASPARSATTRSRRSGAWTRCPASSNPSSGRSSRERSRRAAPFRASRTPASGGAPSASASRARSSRGPRGRGATRGSSRPPRIRRPRPSSRRGRRSRVAPTSRSGPSPRSPPPSA